MLDLDLNIYREIHSFQLNVIFYHAKYFIKDVISGTVVVKSSTAIQHSGLLLSLDGNVTINASNRAGVFEVFYNNAKVARIHFHYTQGRISNIYCIIMNV